MHATTRTPGDALPAGTPPTNSTADAFLRAARVRTISDRCCMGASSPYLWLTPASGRRGGPVFVSRGGSVLGSGHTIGCSPRRGSLCGGSRGRTRRGAPCRTRHRPGRTHAPWSAPKRAFHTPPPFADLSAHAAAQASAGHKTRRGPLQVGASHRSAPTRLRLGRRGHQPRAGRTADHTEGWASEVSAPADGYASVTSSSRFIAAWSPGRRPTFRIRVYPPGRFS